MNSEKSFPPLRAVIAIFALVAISMVLFGAKTSLDIKLYYTGAAAIDFLTSLTAEQVQIYFRTECLDLIFLSCYTFFFFRGMRALHPQNKVLQLFALVPGFFDLIETGSILFLLKHLDELPNLNWLGWVTFFKWTLGFVVVVILGLSYFRRKKV